VTLAFDDSGDPARPVVVLLHSTVCDRRMWDPQWRPLIDAGLRAVRFDFRGHGDTPAPTADFSPAEDVIAAMDAAGLDRVGLVGASYGGRVAQEIAARWPDRVRSIALICAATRTHPSTAAIEAFAHRENELLEAGDVEAAVELNVATFLGPGAGADTRSRVAMMQRRAFDVQLAAPDVDSREADFDLRDIAAPSIVVSGAHDLDYFQSIADMLASTIPHAQRVHLDWAGHLPSLEDPPRFAPILLDWLSGHER